MRGTRSRKVLDRSGKEDEAGSSQPKQQPARTAAKKKQGKENQQVKEELPAAVPWTPAEASAASRRKSTRSSKGTHTPCTAAGIGIDNLPNEVLQVIGSYLSKSEYKAARLVNRTWAKNMTQAIDKAHIQLHPDPDCTKSRMGLLCELQPLAKALTLLIGGRIHQVNFAECIPGLTAFKQLQHLQLNFLVPAAPKASSTKVPNVPLELSSLTLLKGLQSLTVNNSKTVPNQEDLKLLSRLTQLTKLVIRIDIPPDSPHVNNAGLAALRKPTGIVALKSLRHLEAPPVVLSYGPSTPELSPHPLTSLSNLTHLVSLGSPLSEGTICALTKITSLQVLEVEPPMHSNMSVLGLDQPHLRSVGVAVHDHSLQELSNQINFCASRLREKATKLSIRSPGLLASHIKKLADFTWLRSLDLEASSGEFLPLPFGHLSELTELKNLHHFSFRKRVNASLASYEPTFFELSVAWSNSLTSLDLEGIISSEFSFDGGRDSRNLLSLKRLVKLEKLTLKCSDLSDTMMQLDLKWLPPSLQFLELRWFVLIASERPTHLTKLRRLSLTRCITGSNASFGHFKNMLESLPDLSSLELEDVHDLSEQHIMHIRPLTQLTSLSVVAVGNHHVTNSMLGFLTTLTGLRRLKWHAGDMLDSILDPAFLKAFPNLFVLSLTTSMFYRMTRWSALNVMDFLPYCQLETVGL